MGKWENGKMGKWESGKMLNQVNPNDFGFMISNT